MIVSINPTTEQKICEFKETSFQEIDLILENSKIAQKEWANKSKEERILILLNVKNNFLENKDDLIQTINEEAGFDVTEIEGVFCDVIDGFDYYINKYKDVNTIEFPIDQNVFPESTSDIKFYPQGVILQIGAWNYPLWQTMITAIPALLVGNSIIYKPSERTTKTGLLISKLITESINFPNDLFSVVIGGKEEGEYLVKKDVDLIVYTGNIETGKEIISSAGIKPLVLELSGNDAAIVCADCNLNQTIDGVVSGAFLHSGEVCDRIKRVYVVKEIAEDFIFGVVNKTNTIIDKITPIISKEQLEKIDKQVKKTVQDGAEVLIGGEIQKKTGFFYEPTILKLKHNNVESVNNEIFGPVFSILVVENEEEAIKLSNSTRLGLGTSIWTQDFKKAEIIADKCESGMIWINDSNIPLVCGEWFKGWKSTSISNSSDRLHLFLKSKTCINFKSANKRSWWF